MKKQEKKEKKKNKEHKIKSQKPYKGIDDLIDELAYISENENIRKSKRFLDDIYMLDQE